MYFVLQIDVGYSWIRRKLFSY